MIVVDSSHPLVRRNLCFDPEHEYSGCGHAINVRLAREAALRGIDTVTADVYLAMSSHSEQAICLTDMITPLTENLLANGVQPTVCMSLESPLNARNFYHHIARYAGRFRHNYQFRGTQSRLCATDTVFHPIVFPMETRMPLPLQCWNERSYLILVNSNKRAVDLNWSSLKWMARSVASQVYFWGLQAVDPWMRVREIYLDRILAIQHFSRYSDFSLYGLGWDRPIPVLNAVQAQLARHVWAGPLEYSRKREVMSNFKFALCFENCVFPGYITEKIFDCLLSGCIPVYFGAPDISDFVPAQTFIDYRQFENYSDLDQFLRGMTETEARRYLDTAHDFLASPAFDKFTVDYFINDILNTIEQEF